MPKDVGTVTDPVWYEILTCLFLGLAVALVLLAIASLIAKWRETRAERRPKPLPRTTRRDWFVDTETPIGNQLLREYGGGLR